jgi:hypothetical protein
VSEHLDDIYRGWRMRQAAVDSVALKGKRAASRLERFLSSTQYALHLTTMERRVRAAQRAAATRAYRGTGRTKTRDATEDEMSAWTVQDYGIPGRLVTPVNRSAETVSEYGECMLPKAFDNDELCWRKDFHHHDEPFGGGYGSKYLTISSGRVRAAVPKRRVIRREKVDRLAEANEAFAARLARR